MLVGRIPDDVEFDEEEIERRVREIFTRRATRPIHNYRWREAKRLYPGLFRLYRDQVIRFNYEDVIIRHPDEAS